MVMFVLDELNSYGRPLENDRLPLGCFGLEAMISLSARGFSTVEGAEEVEQ